MSTRTAGPHTKKRILAVLTSGFCLTACGTSGDADDQGGGGGDGDLIQIRLLVAPVFFEPAYIGQDEGFFEAEGLEIEIVEGGAAAEAIPQIVSGEVDIGATGGVSLISAVEQGIPVQAISGLQNTVPEPITSGLLVRDDGEIEEYADLEGKAVGLQALQETTHAGTLLAAEDAGVDPDEVEFVQLPLPNLNEALDSGEVDAIYNIGSFYPTGINMGFEPLGTPASEFLTGGPSALWFTSTELIAEDQDVVEAFNRAMEESIDFATDHPERVQELQVEHTDQDPDYIESAPIQPLTPLLDQEGIEATINAMVRYQFLPSSPAYDDVVWDEAPHTS